MSDEPRDPFDLDALRVSEDEWAAIREAPPPGAALSEDAWNAAMARTHELRSMPYAEYLRTPEWADRRRAALHRAAGRCQVCNRAGRLNVHHRTYARRGAERPADLTVLCEDCHHLFHEHGRLVSVADPGNGHGIGRRSKGDDR